MNKYLFQYKIATVAELTEPFEYKGYQFTAYNPKEWWNCDAWVASKVVEGEHAGVARYKFIKDLFPLIEKFSVVSQCAFRLAANTYVIYKQTNNAEKILYIYFVRKTGHTGLHFDEEQQEQLVKLEKLPNQKAWFYINEAANATTFYTRLAMLIGAVEGIAGEKTIKGRKKTNFEVSKKILGEELYKKMYEQGKGIRHQLLHGNVNTEEIFDGLNDELYTKIRIYLKTEYNVELYEDVVHPQRNFHDNFEYAGMFMKFVNEPVLDLKIIEDAVDDDKPQHHLKQKEIFTYLGETPKSY